MKKRNNTYDDVKFLLVLCILIAFYYVTSLWLLETHPFLYFVIIVISLILLIKALSKAK